MFKRSVKDGMLTSFLPDLVGYVSRHWSVKKLPMDVWKEKRKMSGFDVKGKTHTMCFLQRVKSRYADLILF